MSDLLRFPNINCSCGYKLDHKVPDECAKVTVTSWVEVVQAPGETQPDDLHPLCLCGHPRDVHVRWSPARRTAVAGCEECSCEGFRR